MTELKLITARPVPCDLAREHCTQIYNDYRLSTLSQIEMMMLAYRAGMTVGRTEEAIKHGDFLKAWLQAHGEPEVLEALDREDRDHPSLPYASWVDDPVIGDQRALARQYKR